MKKSALVQTRISPDIYEALKALALENDMTISALLRVLVQKVVTPKEIEDDETPTPQNKLTRDVKVTINITKPAKQQLEKEAMEMGVPTAAWTSSLIMSRFRDAPQPPKSQRKHIRKAMMKLAGMSTNLNQIAKVMNRGVFTGSNYAPSKTELQAVTKTVAEARRDFAKFAAGLLTLQSIEKQD